MSQFVFSGTFAAVFFIFALVLNQDRERHQRDANLIRCRNRVEVLERWYDETYSGETS